MRVFSVYALFSERKYSLKTDICLMYFSFLPAIGKVCNVQPKNTAPFLRRQSLPLYVRKAPAMMPVFCMCNGKKSGRRTPATKNAADVCLPRKIRKIFPYFKVLSRIYLRQPAFCNTPKVGSKHCLQKAVCPLCAQTALNRKIFAFFSLFCRKDSVRKKSVCEILAFLLQIFSYLFGRLRLPFCAAQKCIRMPAGTGSARQKFFIPAPAKLRRLPRLPHLFCGTLSFLRE